MNSLVRASRAFWISSFCLFSAGFGYWLIRNLLTPSYVGKGAYLTRIAMSFFLLWIGWGFVAFRSTNARLVECTLSLGATLLVIAVSEASIRVWDWYDPIFRPANLEDRVIIRSGPGQSPHQAYGPYPPGANVVTHGHEGRINSLGFRGPEYPIEKAKNTFRILALGDSFTFGQGVEESDVYTSVLESELSARYPEKKIEVVNTGVMGYSAIDEMNLLYRLGDFLDPDLVLVGFYDNDVKHSLTVTPERHRWALPVPEQTVDVLLRHSKLLRWFSMRYDEALLKLAIRSDEIEAEIDRAYDVNSEDWKQFVLAYRLMNQWTKTHDIPPLVVGLLLATPYQNLELNDFIRAPARVETEVRHVRQVQRVLDDMGIITVDLVPAFQLHNRENMMVSKWEGHPNAVAHRIYAEGFLRTIESRKLIQ
jgi:lysophospholipase L1-like esterase